MRVFLTGALCLFAFGAHAQTVSVQYDLSGLAGQVTALQSSMPTHCSVTPSNDTLNASLASSNCFQSALDTRATLVQAAGTTTDSSGNWSITWSKPFSSTSYYVNPQPGYSAAITQPYMCNYNTATQTTTFVQGMCWQTQTTTLSGVLTSVLGAVINPTGSATSIPVRVGARDRTQ